jgi:hypothetical protein
MPLGTYKLQLKSYSFFLFFYTGNNKLEKYSANDLSCHLYYAQKCNLSTYLNYDNTVVDTVGVALLSDLTGDPPAAEMKK